MDVLVNNAGFGLHGAFAELPLARQLEIIQVNVTALTELTGLFLPGMIQRRRGGILNVGSVAGFLPGPNMAVYYATKAFVQSFTEALAEELRRTGLTVSALCPGPTESNFGTVARGEKERQIKTPKMSAIAVALWPPRISGRQSHRNSGNAKPGVRFFEPDLPRPLPRKIVKRYNRMED